MVVGCQPYSTAAFTPQYILLVLISVRPQGRSAIGSILYKRKTAVTPAGIEPATIRFLAEHLNHCATAVPVKIGTVSQTQVQYLSF